MTRPGIMRRAQSVRPKTADAIAEVLIGLAPEDLALIVLFVGEGHDLRQIEHALADLPETVHLMGCTTAGEIGKGGYLDHSITALGLPRDLFRVAVGSVPTLSAFDPERARTMAFDLRAGLTFSNRRLGERGGLSADGRAVADGRPTCLDPVRSSGPKPACRRLGR